MKLVLSLIFVSWSLSQAYSQEAPWYEQALVGIETGPTGAQFGSDVADLGAQNLTSLSNTDYQVR